MDVRWLTAFIDRAERSFVAATDFWSAATDSTLSAARGAANEFATLLPANGDAYLRVHVGRVASHGQHALRFELDLDAAHRLAQVAGSSVHSREG